MVFLKIICCGRLFFIMRLRMFLSPPPLFFAASENALFSKTQPITKSKLPILLMGFRPDNQLPLLQCRFDKTLVGYENGLIVVINEDGAMLKVVDIINKQLPANRKSESFYGI
jgi:hypothetical protein